MCIQFVNSKLLAALGQLPGGTLAAGAPLLSADRQSNKGILFWEKLNIHPTYGLKSFLSISMSSWENWPVLFKSVCRRIWKTVPLRPASSLSFSSWHGNICNVCKNNSNINWLSPLNLANDTWHCRKQVKAAGSAPHTCYTLLQTATSLPPPVMWSPHRGVELDGKPFPFLDLLMQDGGESGAWDPFALFAWQFAHLGEAVRADQG